MAASSAAQSGQVSAAAPQQEVQIIAQQHQTAANQQEVQVTAQEHQRFNQWLKYNIDRPSSKKHADCQTLASLYEQCGDAASRKQFISKWLKSGGSRGDTKLMVTQALQFTSEESRCTKCGWITPGQISELMKVDRNNYGDDMQGYMSALRFLIQQNHAAHPPPAGTNGVREGIDFWTCLYFYTHKDMDRVLQKNEQKHMMERSNELSAGAATTPAFAQAMLSTDLEAPASLEDKEKEDKAALKAKALEAKKLKIAQKQFSGAISLMAKCRSHALVEEQGQQVTNSLNKMELELSRLQPKAGQTLDDLEFRVEAMAGITIKLHSSFPQFAPRKPKLARVESAAEVVGPSDARSGGGFDGAAAAVAEPVDVETKDLHDQEGTPALDAEIE